MGRVANDYYVQDGVVPRTKLPEVLRRIAELEREYGLRVGNVFHAGDGNLHPLVLYDERVDGEPERARALAEAILEACIDAGGSLTGEHGIGVDKVVLDAAALRLATTSSVDAAAPPRVRPGRPLQPRQGLPDAAALRRGARAVPRASAREGRALPSVSEIRRACTRRPSCSRARRTGQRVSIERDGGDVVLSTRRLDQVLEHEAGDLTCIVEAGMRVRDLNERLAEHGQMLALDPPGNPTIGACLAANLSGPRRHRYGTARDLVIGVTVVLADGTVASSGGKVVKNVAGLRPRQALLRVGGAARPDRAASRCACTRGPRRRARSASRSDRRRTRRRSPGSSCTRRSSCRRSTSSGPAGWRC